MDQSRNFKSEFTQSGTMSIFNDSGNPLLTLVAIFARLLEQRATDGTHGDKAVDETGNEANKGLDDASQSGSGSAVKRTTRGASKRKEQESSQALKELQENAEA